VIGRSAGPPAASRAVQVGAPGAASASARSPRTQAGPARGARWLLLLIVSLGSVHVLFMLGVEGLRLARAELAISGLEREVAELEREAEHLRTVVEHGDDLRYREQLARRQGYMYPGELRIVTRDQR
jgi:hypothetical protein